MTNNSLQRADEGPSKKIPAMGETFVRKPKVRLPLGQGKEATQWRRPQSALDLLGIHRTLWHEYSPSQGRCGVRVLGSPSGQLVGHLFLVEDP